MLRREANPLFGRRLGEIDRTDDAEALVTLWPNRWQPEIGEELQTTWPSFLDVLTERRPWRGPHEHAGWSGATFSPMLRAPGNVRSVAALIGHVRRGASRFSGIAKALSGLGGVLYSTHEHQEHAHAFTIVLPFARPASRQEHARAVEWLERSLGARAETKGVLIEPQPGAFCYLPSWRPGQPWNTLRLNGAFLEPDACAIPGEER